MFTLYKFDVDRQPNASQRAVMGLSRIISFLGMLALFGPSAALAQVTGISYEPRLVAACALVTITVTGVGNCPSLYVSFGDSTSTALTPPPPFPVVVYHTYKSAGTFTLDAANVGRARRCPVTKVTTNVSVAGPTVTSVYPFSVIKPLGAVILLGQHFGSLPGQFLIHVMNYKGQSIDLPLDGIQWGDTFVSGTIPPMSGVLKQTATFTIVTQCGASTTWQAPFTPLTSWDQIAFNQVTCSTSIGAGPSDRCQNWGNINYPWECWGNPNWGVDFNGGNLTNSYYAFHASGWGGGNTGNDQFWPSPSLKNDWVYDSYTLQYYNYGGGSQETITGVNANDPTTPVLGANWHVDACGVVEYGGTIFITGPANVPYW